MGLRAMQHEDGRGFLRMARAARIAGAKAEDYTKVTTEEQQVLGLVR